MAWSPGRGKFTRIQDLIDWGFNAPVYFLFHHGLEIPNTEHNPVFCIRYFTHEKGWKRYSVRVVQDVGKAMTSIINKSAEKLYDYNDVLHKEFFDKGHDLIIAEGIPVSDRWSGCIEVYPDGRFVLEVICGGPVRELTHSKRTADLRIASNLDSDRWRYHSEFELVKAISAVRTLGPFGHIIYEFSVFNFPVGCKKEQVIFWEYEVLHGLEECAGRICCTSSWCDYGLNLFKAEGAN
jgi:hypothetical protein